MVLFSRITDQNCVFFFCDLQEALRGKIENYDEICDISGFYMRAAKILNIPFFINIVIPSRNGELVKEVKE